MEGRAIGHVRVGRHVSSQKGCDQMARYLRTHSCGLFGVALVCHQVTDAEAEQLTLAMRAARQRGWKDPAAVAWKT